MGGKNRYKFRERSIFNAERPNGDHISVKGLYIPTPELQNTGTKDQVDGHEGNDR